MWGETTADWCQLLSHEGRRVYLSGSILLAGCSSNLFVLFVPVNAKEPTIAIHLAPTDALDFQSC